MFEFPKLPTDSLYKFVFVAGILILSLGIVLFTSNRGSEYDAMWKLHIADIHAVDSLSHNKNLIEEYKNSLNGMNSKKLDLPIKSPVSIKMQIDSLNKENLRLESDIIYYKNKLGIWDTFEKRMHYGVLILPFLGVFVAILGCIFWYKRLQKYQDIMLQLQIEQLKSQIKNEVTTKPIVIGRKRIVPVNIKRKF